MPSFVTLLLHPDRRRAEPEPQRVDLRAVILAGMGLWTVALVVCGVLLVTGTAGPRGVSTCVAGLLLGGAALWWEHRHRAPADR
ncbi:DUF2530 domain-containing protein [Cellulosimicrobium marinum]|uniref:DUF2530 domain-containing protein n=1 Tax=Cellulosimicrobium marinum TaxID=1638992 RepID=UPI001E2B694D|nr:DUF2530 domain-containing protein [Cellulosimicrobium marinum]MCB7136939.1 DUF2530 domain-containing protein [Cellulosimicrobium marinum]